jgi:hypothetical protein
MEDNQEYTDENIFVSGDKTPSAASRHLPQGGEKHCPLSEFNFTVRFISPLGGIKGGFISWQFNNSLYLSKYFQG